MPLGFLKRKGDGDKPAAAAQPAPAGLPEEVVAQDYQLKLYYAGKSTEGVRMRAGPKALAELPRMLEGLTRNEVEVVEPLELEFAQAVPVIARPSEAMQWLNAHHELSPVTRHALVVLESIDAVDLAFDTLRVHPARRRGRTRPATRSTTPSSAASRPTGTRRRAT